MKKVLFLVIVLIIFSFECVHTATNAAKRIDTYAALSDGEIYNYTVYDLEGFKAFQIEDIAYILKGTKGGFDVASNDNTYIVNKNTEFSGISSKTPQSDSPIPFYDEEKVNVGVDGVARNIKAYNIDGCTYFKIRDISQLIGFALDWDSDNFALTLKNPEDNTEYAALTMLSTEQAKAMERRKSLDPSKPMLALTFDDGPKKGSTERILSALEKTGSRATFFVVGEMAEKYPELIKAENELGCQIGNHTYNHVNLVKSSADTIKTQINKTSNLVYDLTGKYTMIGRPPYGSINDTVRNNFSIAWFNWNIDTLDWKNKDASYVKDYVLENAKDGAVMLMHDLHSTTADAMEGCIPELVNRGYQLVTMDELIEFKYGGDASKVPGYIK